MSVESIEYRKNHHIGILGVFLVKQLRFGTKGAWLKPKNKLI